MAASMHSSTARRGVDWATRGIILLVAGGVAWLLLGFLRHADLYLGGTLSILVHFVIPAACLIGLGLASLGSLELRARVALAAVTAVISLLAVDLALRHVVPNRLERLTAARKRVALDQGRSWDERSKRDVVNELRASGERALPTIHYTDLRRLPDILLPVAGVSNALTVYTKESGQFLVYESDEHGFHNPPGLSSGALQVAALGDSFVHGEGVASDRNMVARLRERFPRTRNFGWGGQGPLLMLATLREYVARQRPGVVLWFYYDGNDLMNLDLELRDERLAAYLDPAHRVGLAERQPEIDATLASIVEAHLAVPEPERLPSPGLLERIRAFTNPPPGLDPDWAAFERVLRLARAEVEAWQGRLIFVYLPQYDRYGPSGADRDRGYHDGVRAIVERVGLPFVDARQAFDRHGDPRSLYTYGLPGHFSESGYGLVADRVLTEIGGRDGPGLGAVAQVE